MFGSRSLNYEEGFINGNAQNPWWLVLLSDRSCTNSYRLVSYDCGILPTNANNITTPVRRTRLSGRPWAAGKNAGEVPHPSWTTRCSLRRTFFLDIRSRCPSPSSKYPDIPRCPDSHAQVEESKDQEPSGNSHSESEAETGL